MGAIKEFNGRVIYNPSGKAKEYSYWAANFYVGCSNGCSYCYLKKGRGAKVLGGDFPTLKKSLNDEPSAINMFSAELEVNKSELQKHGLFFSFTTDPLLPTTIGLSILAIEICQKNNVPVKILSKCADGMKLIVDIAKKSGWDTSKIAIGATLTGCDELEPHASPNRMRIIALARAKRHGFRTFASVEPIPVGMFDRAYSVIALSYPFVDLFKIGLQSGQRYTKRDTMAFFNSVSEYWEAHPDKTPRIYWKDSFLSASGIVRELLPAYCVNRNYNLF